MVPSHFNQHNVSKLLNLLETSLRQLGKVLYSIGYPLYQISYRTYKKTSITYKKVQKIVKKQDFKSKYDLLGSLLRQYIEEHITLLQQALLKFSHYLRNFIDFIQQDANEKLSDITVKKQKDIKSKFKTLRIYIRQLKPSPDQIEAKKEAIQYNLDDKKQEFELLIVLIKSRVIPLKKQARLKLIEILKSSSREYSRTSNFLNKRLASLKLYLDATRSSSIKYLKSRHQTVLSTINRFKGRKVKWATYGLATIFLALIISTITMWFTILEDLPSPKVLAARDLKASTKIYDRNGVLLYKIYKDENRTPVSLSEIPEHVKQATLAIEDSEFYTHPGFSIRGMTRAMIRNYQRGELTGGSTITQQLVKNVLLTPEKTLTRKLREIVLAVEVEMNYTKDEILEMYLNEVSYGGTAYGIQEAATMYFDKDVDDLTLAEAALLAGLPKSPTDYSPFGADPQASVKRRVDVLRQMEENGYITHEERVRAQQQKLTFTSDKIDIKAPHFVMYVKEQLEQKYSKEMVEQGGLEVYTTLDYQTQLAAEEIVKDEVESLSYLNVGNGAAVILSPSSGEILAMVGSKDYYDYENDGNVNVATSLRQPGSSIKLINYAYALSNGLTPATIIDDSPTTFLIKGSPPYKPKNYDGKYRGRITLRSAFAESRNIPAVKVLNGYGVSNMIEMGKKMGITTWEDKNRFGLSLTLGGGEVKLIDLAQAYATVANYGRRPELTSVLKVTDYKGNVLESNECESKERSTLIAVADKLSSEVHASESAVNLPFAETTCEGEEVLDPRVAYLLTDILKDNDARAPAFGRNSLLNIADHPEIAVKTGTSNDLRDNLTVGYNQNYLVAVWVGNNDNTPMSRVASGITGASPIFNKLMTYLVKDQPSDQWTIPSGLVKENICPYTGTLSCSGCPTVSEWFLKEDKPDKHCSQDWFRENNDKKDDQDKNNNSNSNRRNDRIPEWLRDRFDD